MSPVLSRVLFLISPPSCSPKSSYSASPPHPSSFLPPSRKQARWNPELQWTTSSMSRTLTSSGELSDTPFLPLRSTINIAFYSMIMPRNAHTNIGDSEYPGGMKTYCSPNGRYDSKQGQLPAKFWKQVAFKSGKSSSGGRYAQRMYIFLPFFVI